MRKILPSNSLVSVCLGLKLPPFALIFTKALNVSSNIFLNLWSCIEVYPDLYDNKLVQSI